MAFNAGGSSVGGLQDPNAGVLKFYNKITYTKPGSLSCCTKNTN